MTLFGHIDGLSMIVVLMFILSKKDVFVVVFPGL